MDRKAALNSAAESRYWTQDEAFAVLRAFAASGLPLSQFARQHGIGVQRIRWWRARLQGRESSAPAVKFAEVVLQSAGAPAAADGPHAIEVVLPSGVRVTAGGGTRAAEIAELVRALRDAGC